MRGVFSSGKVAEYSAPKENIFISDFHFIVELFLNVFYIVIKDFVCCVFRAVLK